MAIVRILRSVAVVMCTMSVSPTIAGQASDPVQAFDRDSWMQRILQLKTHKPTAFEVLPTLIELHPDEAFGVIESAWPRIQYDGVKTGILKAFEFGGHPRVLDVLDLGINDPDLRVRRYAFNYVAGYAFADLAEDYAGYRRWRDATRDKPVADVTTEACRRFLDRLRDASDEERIFLANASKNLDFGRFPQVREAALDGGILDLFTPWLTGPKPDSERVGAAQQALRSLQPPESYVREVLMPLGATSPSHDVRYAVFSIIQSKEYGECARDYAIDRLKSETDGELFGQIGRCLAAYQDLSVIPEIIGVIDAAPDSNTVYGLGYFALTPLTGVEYDESHDGTWWRAWWERNRSQFSEEIRARDVPDLKGKIAYVSGAGADPLADVQDVPAEDRRAAKSEDMRYFLVGDIDKAKAPPGGYKLIVVLPGGAGSADMHPFVRRVWKHALGPDYLVAQLVSKEWSSGQFEKLVWPTEVNPWDNMQFSTEKFAKAVIDEIRAEYTIDERRTYVFAWSSGGPAAYAMTLQKDSPFTGAFIAMSVFKPNQAPPLENARGKAFYLLSSPDDRIIPIAMPRGAADQLGKNGATVQLDTYEGGHGWHGDVYGMIRKGIGWLDGHTQGATAEVP